jgi:hypothetical protein
VLITNQYMKPATIFVTYNPNNDFEQTLAVRLQTLGAIHGFSMLMPDRYEQNTLVSQETLFRIKSSDYFIFFSTSALTPTVQKEIEAAYQHLHDKSKIVIVYDRVKNLQHDLNCTEVYIDASKHSVQDILQQTIDSIQKNRKKAIKAKQDTENAIGAILLVGLGLLALNSLSSSK